MKVLFINNFRYPDYLNDSLFHGLNQLDIELYVTGKANYMLKSYPDKQSLYGRGFTLFGTLNECPDPEPQEIILKKINDHYYDLIMYGSLHRDRSYFDNVSLTYSKDEILSFDGEDFTDIYEPFVQSTIYHKRENTQGRLDVKNISFSIPKEKIIKHEIEKIRTFATIIPGNTKTYSFHTEKDYYEHYASSYYAFTWKKAGWDCMRHYEILAAGCVPAFIGLECCPEQIMTSYPKDLIINHSRASVLGRVGPDYFDLRNELIHYTEQNLTTEKTIRSILV